MFSIRNSLAFLALGIGLNAGLAHADDQTITIAYQTGFSPFVRAVASGEIEKIPGVHVEFRRFNSGAEIFAAIASGDVQIGDVGSRARLTAAEDLATSNPET